MSFGINKISMSSFGPARLGLAWLGLAMLFGLRWLGLTWLDIVCHGMAWPESGMCQISDWIGHRRPRFSFVAVCFSCPCTSCAPQITMLDIVLRVCLLVFSLSHSHFVVKSFLWTKVNAIPRQSSQSLLSHYGDSESERKWLSGRINLVLFFLLFALLHSHVQVYKQTICSVLALCSYARFVVSIVLCYIYVFLVSFFFHFHHCA